MLRWLCDRFAPRGRPFRWALPLLVAALALLAQWRAPNWTARAEGWTVDARFRLRGVESPHAPIVIIAIDETSFQMLGDLHGENVRTWPRARWADLIGKIAAGSPRLIALDAVFDTPGWDAGGDEAMAEAMLRAGNVVLPANLEVLQVEGYASAVLSLPVDPLDRASAGVGVSALPVEADGAIRRLTLLYSYGGQAYPAYALVVATLWAGRPISASPRDLGSDLTLPIHFRGPEGTFRTLSLVDLWSGETSAEIFRDAIVLVGYTTTLEQDRHAAPFAGRRGMPGVEIQANAVDTLLAGDWLHRPPAWAAPALVAMAGLLALAALNLPRPGLGLSALLILVAIYSGLGWGLFTWADFLLPLVAPTAVALVVGGTALAERMLFAERDKRRLRQRFAGVMSPERLQAVLEHWEDLLRPDRPLKEAAILFADVRGFTGTTEYLMRAGRVSEMTRFLSAYLDAMLGAVVLEGGVIYNVMGDGLLILFGLPDPLPDHALHAVRAAVRMAQATEALQAAWPLREERPLRIGIGIHCGPVVDAVIGKGRRLDYSVIGDPANTAARVEAHCKEAMAIPRPPGPHQVPDTVTILISVDLYEKVRGSVLVDDTIPPFEARGKSEPLRVVRLLGLQTPLEGNPAGAKGRAY